MTLGVGAPARALRAFGLLLRRRDLAGAALLIVLCGVALLNTGCMWLEDRLVPGLETLPLDRVIFILGHHRSGTTNLHKMLASHPNLRCGTMADALFPSLFLKRLFRTRPALWIRRSLDRTAAQRYDSANHAVGLEEELEEHLWLLHRLRSEAFLLMFPSLVAGAPERMADVVQVTDADFHFVTRCLRRMLYDDPHATYVARPLLFTMHVQALLRHVPGARVVLCVREPQAAIRSHGAMTQAQLRSAPDDPRLSAWVEGFYRSASVRQYQAMLELLSDPTRRGQVLAVDFDALHCDPAGVVKALVEALGLPPAELVPVRSEKHSGEAPQLIARERIDRDLGEVYRQLLTCLPQASHA
jgi:hypothetical protein